MLTVIEGILSQDEVADFCTRLLAASWEDGVVSAGSRAVAVKRNLQLPDRDPLAVELGKAIVASLAAHPLFVSAALAERIHPPRFNLYQSGGEYGVHVDAALMRDAGTGPTIRADISATLFLSDPGDYDGGELAIETPFGAQVVKLPAGDVVLYPSSSLHRVAPVTRGARLAAITWIQSAIADERARVLLFDLDQSIQALSLGRPLDDPDIDRLTQVYHNLVRRWAQP